VVHLDFPSLLVIALGLSADCFAVALGGGMARKAFSFPPALRLSLAFGVFQAIMPVLGWLAGRTVIAYISPYDHWLAFGLLVLVGGRMLWESFHERGGERAGADISRGLLLFTLSLATSVDSLAVGLGLAFLEANIALASATIGTVAFLVTLLGFWLGRRVGALVGRRAEVVGGIVLILIGLRILLEHVLE
jgi:putative Mn2+ efflux pump MntP